MDLDRLHEALVNADKAGDTEAATALAQQIRSMQPPAEDSYTRTAKSDSNTDNLLASIGGAMYGPYLGIKQRLGLASPEDVAQYKQSMSGLFSTPMGKAGTVAGGLAVAAPLAVIPGANTLAGAALSGAALGGVQPTSPDESVLRNMTLGAAGSVAGQAVGKGIASALANRSAAKAASLAQQQTNNAARDATISEAQQAGYVLPPSQVNPSMPNRVLEGFAGKLTTAQQAAAKNEGVTQALARSDLGLLANQPITPEVLQGIRKQAGKAYEAVTNLGTVPFNEQKLADDLGPVLAPYLQLKGEAPSQAIPKLDALIQDVTKPQMEAGTMVELVKRLRFDGFRNLRSPDPETAMLGKFQVAAQNALENQIENHLAQQGNGGLLNAFQAARQQIAKTYTVENALEESTGKVVASKIGKAFSNGKPLSGGLATIGRTAEAFPKAVQNVNTSMPGISPLDFMGGVLTAGATGNPLGALAGLARPVVRSGILSNAYQSAMVQPPKYELGLLGKTLPKLSAAESTRALEQLLGAYGLLGVAPKQ